MDGQIIDPALLQTNGNYASGGDRFMHKIVQNFAPHAHADEVFGP